MDAFLGEIRIFTGNYAPRGWMFCNGQMLPLSQNTALFSVLGTTYGGDGKSTFALPNLQGRMPLHAGSGAGPGLTQRLIGETDGSDSVTLVKGQLPTHSHTLMSATAPTASAPDATVSLANTGDGSKAYNAVNPHAKMGGQTLLAAGAGAPHNNLQPYLALNFIIAIQGIFPPRP
jgi:microcystin-dependent protein